MNFLKSGPELKMPELKVPTFLVDLYWDLRERHLLPLVALAIVAIVAVPFLLSGGSKEEPAAPATSLGAAPSPESDGSKLTVVEAKPGLRDYRKRLRDDKPTDPFVQRYTSPMLAGTKLGNGEESSTSTSTTSTSTSTSTSTTVTKASGNGKTTEATTEGSGASPGHLTIYVPAIDVKIVRTSTTAGGGKDRGEPEVRHRVIPPKALPGEKTQVVTYMGINPTTKAPYFLISDAVDSVFGEAKCLSGTSVCQLIEVEPGMPMTYVYGPDSVRYKITVLKVEPVVAGHT